MKVLCIPGFASTGQIFRRQLAPIMRQLPASTEYVFVEGDIECRRHPGIPDYFTGPFYCWYTSLSPAAINEAHEFLMDIIEDEGPFDGVIAHSQGAGLLIATLMHHELNFPHDPHPFGFAVLMSSPVPVSPDVQLHRDILSKSVQDWNNNAEEPRKSHKGKNKAAPRYRIGLLLASNRENLAQEYIDYLHIAQDGAKEQGLHEFMEEDSWDMENFHTERNRKLANDVDTIPRLLHPLMVTSRISIPTLHVYDPTDFYRKMVELGIRLCEKSLTSVVHHTAGHGIPSSMADVDSCAMAIRKVMEQSERRVSV